MSGQLRLPGTPGAESAQLRLDGQPELVVDPVGPAEDLPGPPSDPRQLALRVGDGLQSLGAGGDPHQLQFQLRPRRVPLRDEERRDPTKNVTAEDLFQALPARDRERFWNLVEPDLKVWAKALGRPLAVVKLLLFAPWIFGIKHLEEDDEGNGRGPGCALQISGKDLGSLLRVSERCAFLTMKRGKKAGLWQRFRRCLSLARLTRDRPAEERLTTCPDPDDPSRELRRLDVHGVIFFLQRGVELIQKRGNTYELRTMAAPDAPAVTVRVLVGPQAYLLSRIAKRLRLAAARLMSPEHRAPAGGYTRTDETCRPSTETEKKKGREDPFCMPPVAAPGLSGHGDRRSPQPGRTRKGFTCAACERWAQAEGGRLFLSGHPDLPDRFCRTCWRGYHAGDPAVVERFQRLRSPPREPWPVEVSAEEGDTKLLRALRRLPFAVRIRLYRAALVLASAQEVLSARARRLARRFHLGTLVQLELAGPGR